MVRPNPSAYARPHASEVRIRKKERRYVKLGSGRCHVFLVSAGANQLSDAARGGGGRKMFNSEFLTFLRRKGQLNPTKNEYIDVRDSILSETPSWELLSGSSSPIPPSQSPSAGT